MIFTCDNWLCSKERAISQILKKFFHTSLIFCKFMINVFLIQFCVQMFQYFEFMAYKLSKFCCCDHAVK